MSDDYPHIRAAFINAIAEEGTKVEAIEWLQKQWNETCALRAENAKLRAALKPFADAAASAENGEKDDYCLAGSSARHCIVLGDLRRAFRVLTHNHSRG